MEKPKRSCSLIDKFSHPVLGPKARWYTGFIMTREDTSVKTVIHNEIEKQEVYEKFHKDAMMDVAINKGWIKGYCLVPTRRTYPQRIKTVRLTMPDSVDRRIWKLLLGNRAYNNLHEFARRVSNPESDRVTARPIPAPKDNTYYGKNYRPGGCPRIDPVIKESILCP